MHWVEITEVSLLSPYPVLLAKSGPLKPLMNTHEPNSSIQDQVSVIIAIVETLMENQMALGATPSNQKHVGSIAI